MHSSAQGPLSAPNWIAHHARISRVCPRRHSSPRTGNETPMLSSSPHGDPRRTRHGDFQRAARDNPDGERAALCNTPRGTTIQSCPSVRESAATRRQVSAGGSVFEHLVLHRNEGDEMFSCRRGCGRAFVMTRTSSRSQVVADGLYDKGWMRVRYLRKCVSSSFRPTRGVGKSSEVVVLTVRDGLLCAAVL